MDSDAALDIKRGCIALVALVGALGCGGSLPGNGGPGGASGSGGASTACCPARLEPLASAVRARGFTAYEGRPVTAVFLYATSAMPDGRATRDTSVSGGAFDLDFQPDAPTCADPAWTSAVGALYIDADGDGACNPAVDYLYTWAGTAGTSCGTVDLPLQSQTCGGGEGAFYALLQAARIVCPATKDCLSCDGGKSFSCLI